MKRLKVVYFHGYKSDVYAIHWRDVRKSIFTAYILIHMPRV